jgi:hypothetical protein
LYVTNWYFIHQSTGYFGADISANPVLHFWSLAVEEQFYLLWPLLLGSGFALTRRMDPVRRMRVLRIAVVVGAVASAIWALSLRSSDPNRAYYGTDARAYELLAGAFLALIPAFIESVGRYRRTVRATTAFCLLALVVVASSWVHLDAIGRGVVVTIATCVLLVAIETSGGGIGQRALSTRPVVYLGKISYGTYLWHWPVILVATRTFHLATISTIGIAFAVATALACLSYEILEQPIRISETLNRHRRVVIAGGLAISVASAVVLIPRIVDPANAAAPTPRATNTAGFTPVPAKPSWRDATDGGGPLRNCFDKPASACTVVRGTGPHILLIGDSHAWMLIPTFTRIARRDDLTLSVSVKGGCPWQQNLYSFPVVVAGRPLRTEDCKRYKDDLYARVIPALHADLIITMNVGHEDPTQIPFLGPDGKYVPQGTPRSVRWNATTTRRSLAALRATGSKVLLLEPIPVTKFDPLKCLSTAKVLEQCRYVAGERPSTLEQLYRSLADADKGVWSANFDRLVCPFFPICDPLVNGQIVKFDPTHLTPAFAKSIAPAVDAYLKQAGLVPR